MPDYTYTVTGAGQATTTVVNGTFVNGKPGASQVLQRYVFAQTVAFATGLPGSQGTAVAAATASTTFNIQKNGSNVGMMVFATSSVTATFAMVSTTSFAPGDVLTLVAPALPDATLANLAWTLVGTH